LNFTKVIYVYVAVILDVINIWDSFFKSGPKIMLEPDFAGCTKKGQMPDLLVPKSGISIVPINHYT